MRLQPAVARLSVSLAARNQGVKCTLSTVADSAGARLRKMVTGRMAKFDRFPLFSASPEWQMEGRSRAMAENCGNRSRVGRPKLWAATSRSSVGQCRQQLKAGCKLLQVAKHISQHPLGPAANAASVLTNRPKPESSTKTDEPE